MKKLILFTVLLVVTTITVTFAQDTTYYSKEYKELKSSIGASKYKVVEKLPDNRLIEKWYNISGQITNLNHKKLKRKKKIFDGISKAWYKNGQLKYTTNYLKDKEHGEQLYYWDNGVMCRKEFYKKGRFKKGECWDREGKVREYFPRFQKPRLGKTDYGITNFVRKHAVYPKTAQYNEEQGKVLVMFAVDSTGKVCDVKIKKSAGKILDTEAIKIVNSMPRLTPGKLEGEPIKITMSIPINFMLVDKKRQNKLSDSNRAFNLRRESY